MSNEKTIPKIIGFERCKNATEIKRVTKKYRKKLKKAIRKHGLNYFKI